MNTPIDTNDVSKAISTLSILQTKMEACIDIVFEAEDAIALSMAVYKTHKALQEYCGENYHASDFQGARERIKYGSIADNAPGGVDYDELIKVLRTIEPSKEDCYCFTWQSLDTPVLMLSQHIILFPRHAKPVTLSFSAPIAGDMAVD